MKCENCGSSYSEAKHFKTCTKCKKEICDSCKTTMVEEAFTMKHDLHYCDDCVPEVYTYPEGFYDFSNGVDIDKKTIQEWLEECRKQLLHQPVGEFAFRASGNTFVIGFKLEDDYVFYVAKNYKEMEVEHFKIKDIKF